MPRRRGLLIALILGGCGPRAPTRTIRFESTVQSARLDNGLRVLVIEDHDSNVVDLAVRLDVGSSDDPPGKAGLAHLVEHLVFQVPTQPDRRPLLAHLSAVALGFNAATTLDATEFVSAARTDQLAALVEIEGQRFSAPCPSLSVEAFEREREVVRNELRLRSSRGWDSGFERILYPAGRAYARPVAGTDGSVARLSLEDACRFIDAHYRPDRMVVVLTGDIDGRAAIRVVERALGHLAGHGRGRRPPAPPTRPGLRRVQADAFGSSAIVVEWPMPPAWAPDHPSAAVALALLQRALGRDAMVGQSGPRVAPLAIAVIRRRGPADDAEVRAALERVDRAIGRASSMARDDLFAPLVDRLARELMSEFDEMPSRVDLMAAPFQLAADDHVVAHQLARYAHLEAADVRAALTRMFASSRRMVVVVTPMVGRTPAARGEVGLPSYAGRSHEEDWHAPVDPQEADRPLRVPLPRERLRRAERFRLDNGLTVILLRTSTTPLVSARLVFAGGSADDPPGREGLGYLAALLLRPRDHGSMAGSAQFDAVVPLLARSYAMVGDQDTTFAADGLSSHVDAVIAALAEPVVDGDYRSRDLDLLSRAAASKRDRVESAAARTVSERALARARLRVALYAHLFGDGHPYARAFRSLLAAGGPRLRLADLEAVRDERFSARNGVLILCGQFDPAVVRDQVEHRFSDLRGGAPHRVSRPPARPSAGVLTEWTDAADPTTAITVGFPTAGDGAGRAARKVVAAIVDERMTRLREALGAAYAMDVVQDERTGAGAIVMVGLVDSTRSGEAMALMMEEIARLRAGDRDLAEAFVRARRRVFTKIVAESSGAERGADEIARLIARGDDLAGNSQLARQVMELTMADVRSALAAELVASRQVIAIVGSPDGVAAARRAIDHAGERRPGVSPPTQ